MSLRTAPAVLSTPSITLIEGAGMDEDELRDAARRTCESSPWLHHSRSYRHPFAVVGAHEREVGVDLERVVAFDPAFTDSICTPRERRARPHTGSARWQADLWSSKEALAKALGDPLAHDPRRLEAPSGWPLAQAAAARGTRSLGIWRARALPVPEGHVGWVVWRDG